MSEPDRRRRGWLPRTLRRIAGVSPDGTSGDGAGDPASGNDTVQPSTQSRSFSGRRATDLAVLHSGVLDNQETFDRWMRHRQSEEWFAIVRMTVRLVLLALVALGAGTVQQIRFGDPDGVTYALGLVAVISMFGVLAVVLAMFQRRKP